MTEPTAHLSAEQLDQLRQELLHMLSKLERSMKVTDEAARPVQLDQAAVGRLSRIDSLQNQGLTKNLQEREQVKLALVVDALKKLEEGRYGLCESCGEAIRFERLLVFPETKTCAACAA